MLAVIILAGCTNKTKKDITSHKYVTFKVADGANNDTPLEVIVVASIENNPDNVAEKVNQIDKYKANIVDLRQKWAFELVEDTVSHYILVDYNSKTTTECYVCAKYQNGTEHIAELDTCNDRSIILIDQDGVSVRQLENAKDLPQRFTLLRPSKSEKKKVEP
jgi:hypothetical protein